MNLEASITGKYVELLKEIAPGVARIAIFYNPATAPYHEIYIKPFETAAASLGVVPIVASVRDVAELEKVMATQAREPNSDYVIGSDLRRHPRPATTRRKGSFEFHRRALAESRGQNHVT